MILTHNSRQNFYREPYGAVPCETPVLLRCDFSLNPSKPRLYLRFEAYNQSKSSCIYPNNVYFNGNGYTAEFLLDTEMLSEPGLYFYKFSSDSGEVTNEYQITVYEKGLNVPDWFINSVIYQVFPDRFYKAVDSRACAKPNSFLYSNWNDLPFYIKDDKGRIARWEFFGGNLKGIQRKLSYIQKLGADTIYINPIFEARSNHRYDTADYYKIDSLLGGDEAFDDLIESAKDNNVHIILDGVFNHTGKHSKYFSSCRDENSPYKEWFNFYDDGSYDCWWGVDDLPAINKTSQSFAQFVAGNENSVVRYWGKRGISGWRLDVADELSDELLQKIRTASEKEIDEPVIIGEVWENASNKMSYGQRKMYFTKPELHTHTNYVFRDTLLDFLGGKISSYDVKEVFEIIKETYPKHNFFAQVNMTSSHDVVRLFTMLLNITNQDIRLARDLVKCYSLIQFSSAGVPLIYYGDETCLEGGKDPDNRRTYPWDNQDVDMIDWFADLAVLRKNNKALVWGDCEYFAENDGNVFGLLRKACDTESSAFLLVCDRFGKGKEFLLENLRTIINRIDYLREKSYSIEKEAGGYGVLVRFLY